MVGGDYGLVLRVGDGLNTGLQLLPFFLRAVCVVLQIVEEVSGLLLSFVQAFKIYTCFRIEW